MSDDAFSVSVHPFPAGVVLGIRGDLDAHTAPEVLKRLGGLAVSSGQLLVVDLSEMRFCDSSGISTFIAARNLAAAAHADVVLAGVPRQVRRVLGMLGLDALFTVRSGVESAISAHHADHTDDG